MSGVLRVVDLFAGAGGTTTGVLLAAGDLGVRAEAVAVNHWPTAVATHTENHREVRHFCSNIQTVDPLEIVPDGRLDLLWASPECTHHSRARGGKPVSDQKRSGADWVLEWLELLDVRCLILENVEEWLSWGDVKKGKPVSRTRGKLFLRWWKQLQLLGYHAEYRVLNAADFGDATTRKRLFVQARKDGLPIVWPEPTHSKAGSVDLFGELKRWRPARDIIDWSDLGKSLFDRAKPLSLKTRQRIGRGAQRFWGLLAPLYIRLLDLPEDDERKLIAKCADSDVKVFVLSRNGHNDPYGRVRSVDDPLATTTKPRHARVSPLVVPYGPRAEARSTDEPAPTVMTKDRLGVAIPIASVITPGFGEREGQLPRVHDIEEPIPVIAGTGHLHLATATLEAVREALGTIDPRRLVFIDGILHLLDICFRMLKPEELAAAMGFPKGYRFTGTKTEIVRQIGNAVCVGVARALVLAMFGGDAERRLAS